MKALFIVEEVRLLFFDKTFRHMFLEKPPRRKYYEYHEMWLLTSLGKRFVVVKK